MQIIRTTMEVVARRPSVLLFIGIFMFLCSVIDSLNPVLPILMGLTSVTGGTIFESMVSALQIVLTPSLVPVIILLCVGLVLILSVIAGVLFSGVFYMIGKTLDGGLKSKGEFAFGFRKYFIRIFFVTLRIGLAAEVLAVFFAIACVPAIVITRAALTDKPELLAAAILVDILTAGVLFFGLMFSRSYLFYWYPAAFRFAKRTFAAGKRFVDRNFWAITARFFLFDVVFAAFAYLIITMKLPVLKFFVTWGFGTFFSLIYLVFIFQSFRSHNAVKTQE